MTERRSSDLQDAVDLAIIVDSSQQLDSLLADVLQRSSAEADEVEPFTTTRQRFGDDVVDSIEYFLDNRGFSIDSLRDSTETNLDRESTIQLLYDARRVVRTLEVASEEDDDQFEFVCTLPDSDPAFTDLTPSDFDMRQITSALLKLCREAEDDLTVVSPYLESIGVEWLRPGIEAALRRDVDVTIVSRELTTGEPNFEALDNLLELAGGGRGQLSVYDYYEPRPDSQAPLYTLHSKVIVADREAAYVGSANFTRYGFNENLEIGAILRGRRVAELQRVFDFVVDTAREVTRT